VTVRTDAQKQDALARPVPIVIPTLNEAAHIRHVIKSLDDQGDGRRYRFIVVDGGSSDDTVGIALSLRHEGHLIEVLHEPRKIQSAGVNRAAKSLRSADDPVFVRCDAHGSYPPGYVQQLLAKIEETKADSIVVPIDSVGRNYKQQAIAWVSNGPIGSGGSRHRAGRRSGWINHGHHAAFRTERFVTLGGYDDAFTPNEDAEYDARLTAAGGRIYLDATVRMVYFPRSTFMSLAAQYYRYGKARARTVVARPQTLRLRQVAVPGNLLLVCAGGAGWPVAIEFLTWPALYTGALVTTSFFYMAAKRSAVGLLTGVAALTMHSAWGFGFLIQLASGWCRRRSSRW
jgi:succinoglycan biosynthesis protein ExoA